MGVPTERPFLRWIILHVKELCQFIFCGVFRAFSNRVFQLHSAIIEWTKKGGITISFLWISRMTMRHLSRFSTWPTSTTIHCIDPEVTPYATNPFVVKLGFPQNPKMQPDIGETTMSATCLATRFWICWTTLRQNMWVLSMKNNNFCLKMSRINYTIFPLLLDKRRWFHLLYGGHHKSQVMGYIKGRQYKNNKRNLRAIC